MPRVLKDFIRFPHRCEIYTMDDVTPFSEGEKRILWSGRCRKESNTSIRTFKGQDNVLKSDYRVQLGALLGGTLSGDVDGSGVGVFNGESGALVTGIRAGMYIDVTDEQGEFKTMEISDAYCGNIGTTVYCDDAKN